MSLKTDGSIFIFSSPSGAGKTTLVDLFSKKENFTISISHTTRNPRSNEVEGKDYYFVSQEKFETMIKQNEFLEFARVFNNLYGTTKTPVFQNLENGKNVLFDIDWQGAKQLKDSSFKNIVSIFIIPPSKDAIYKRLKSRAITSGDNEKAIENRMNKYETEMRHKNDYDHVVINDKLETCVDELEKIINNKRSSLID